MGTDGSLGGIFQGNRGAEQGHDPSRSFVHRAFIVMDLVDQDLVDLVHHHIHRLGASFWREG